MSLTLADLAFDRPPGLQATTPTRTPGAGTATMSGCWLAMGTDTGTATSADSRNSSHPATCWWRTGVPPCRRASPL